jgi:hypothetical protein
MPHWDHGVLQASNNGRFLKHADGTPFLWLADTAWQLFHRLGRENADHYLKTRADQGFNVIQAVGLAELDGIETPNVYGARPLIDADPTRPDEASGYWDHVEWIVAKAREYGLYIGFLPTWGDKVKPGWGAGPRIFDAENARGFGKWIAERFAKYENIIWVNGGDRDPTDESAVWTALAHGLREGDPYRRLMTFHPQGEQSSAENYHDSDWLDLNMLQTGHGSKSLDIVRQMVQAAYHRTPARPVLDGEPRYENHPIGFNLANGYFVALDVRQAVLTGLFSGGCGFTYGCHAVWQMACDAYEPINNPISHWKYSLGLPGANQVQVIGKIMAELPWHRCRPDSTIVADRSGIPALVRDDEKLIALYSPGGAVRLSNRFDRSGWRLRWVSPVDGEVQDLGSLEALHLEPPKRDAARADRIAILER